MPRRNDYWREQRRSARTDLWSGGGRMFRTWMRTGPRGSVRTAFSWRFAGIIGIGFLACALVVPLIWTASEDACTAFENAFLHRSKYEVFGAKYQGRWRAPAVDAERRSASSGLVGREIARIEDPWLPEVASCTLLFWQVRIST